MSLIHTIPFGRPMIFEEERAAVADVLAGTILTHGPQGQGVRARVCASSQARRTRSPSPTAWRRCTSPTWRSSLALATR